MVSCGALMVDCVLQSILLLYVNDGSFEIAGDSLSEVPGLYYKSGFNLHGLCTFSFKASYAKA